MVQLFGSEKVMKTPHLFGVVLLVGLLSSSCTVDSVCPGGWMTFFIDQQLNSTDEVTGTICAADNNDCQAIPPLWQVCQDRPSLCGSPSAYACIAPGSYNYSLVKVDDPSVTVDDGNFNLPSADGSLCKARIFVNGPETHVQFLSCFPGSGEELDTGSSNEDVDEDETTEFNADN